MKQGTLLTRMVIVVLFAAVMVYLGVTVWQGMSDPYQLVGTYAYELYDAASLEGVVVRSEEVIPGASALSEVLPQEGEKLGAGAAVALVYQNEAAMADRREARTLELQLEQLGYAMRRGDDLGDGAKLDSQLVSTLSQIKSGVSSGTLSHLEEDGLDLRSLVLKRTGDATSSAQSLAALQSAAAEVEGRLNALNASAARGTRTISITRGGLFSGLADGCESVMTPDSLDELTVDKLDQWRDQEHEPLEDALGKLITSSTWYYAADVTDEEAKRLEEGNTYTLSFAGDFDREVPMRLDRLGPSEGGRRVVVFSSNRYLSQATLVRSTGAKLVFQRFAGVRIPDQALRVRDNDDGTTTLGVYALVGRQAEFKPVEIVREGEGFYLVRGTSQNRKVLRAGDTLVISSEELFNGKVVMP